jgi:uncharacterized tellurite resistance protein B-like protein
MLENLGHEERLRLMKFVCSFAWADLEVHSKEKELVRKLVGKLSLDKKEAELVEKWLKVPPRPEEVDPNLIPRKHRQIFLDAMRLVISADGRVEPEERESFQVLEELLAAEG